MFVPLTTKQIRDRHRGFTLVEILVSITIIGILASVIFTSFSGSQAQARDNERQVTLKELQLAVEQYRNQTGEYPEQGCGTDAGSNYSDPSCSNPFILDLTPDYIDQLPDDPDLRYSTNAARDRYKLLNVGVETLEVDGPEHEFARCPDASSCGGSIPSNEYAVYSLGAEDW